MKLDVNLLPQTYCRWQIARRRLVQWCCVWVVAVGMVSTIFWARRSGQDAQFVQLQSLEKEYAPLRNLKAEIAGTRELIEDLQVRESLSLELADEQPLLSLIGVVSQAASDCDGKVKVQHLSLMRKTNDRGSKTSQSEAETTQKLLILKGLGENNLAVARFAALLRESQVFDSVGLTSAGAPSQGDTESRSYQLECVF